MIVCYIITLVLYIVCFWLLRHTYRERSFYKYNNQLYTIEKLPVSRFADNVKLEYKFERMKYPRWIYVLSIVIFFIPAINVVAGVVLLSYTISELVDNHVYCESKLVKWLLKEV